MNFDIFNLSWLPLKKLAVIAVAQYYFERPDVVRKMYDNLASHIEKWQMRNPGYGCDCCDPAQFVNPPKFFIALGEGGAMEYVYEQVDLLPIPGKLTLEIKMVVAQLWKKACYWRHHLTRDISMNPNYAEKIYWTSHGEINQLKIIQDFWLLKDSEVPDTRFSRQFMESSLFCLALMCAGENLENENFKESMEVFWENGPTISREVISTTNIIVARWFLNTLSVEYEEYKELVNNYLLSQIPGSKQHEKLPATQLFLHCVSKDFEFGAKHFLKKLTVTEKNDYIPQGAQICIKKLSGFLDIKIDQWVPKADSFNPIIIESILKILLFLMSEMTEIHKLEFIPKIYIIIFKALCSTWPYQELSLEILYPIWPHIQVIEEEFFRIAIITHGIGNPKPKIEKKGYYPYDNKDDRSLIDFVHHNPMVNSATKNVFHRLLCAVMQLISKEVKENVFIKDGFKNLRALCQYDSVGLNIVINDCHLVKYKDTIPDFLK